MQHRVQSATEFFFKSYISEFSTETSISFVQTPEILFILNSKEAPLTKRISNLITHIKHLKTAQ